MTDNLDRATTLVENTIAVAAGGGTLDVTGLADRWDGSPIELLAAAILVAHREHTHRHDPDPTPAPRDWRRATAFLAGWATGDPAVFSPPTEEADRDGRTHHLLAAVAEHAVLGLGLRTNPEQLDEMRRAVAIWTREEITKEDNTND